MLFPNARSSSSKTSMPHFLAQSPLSPSKRHRRNSDPELQAKNLTYRSPIVRMRQLFDLYICLRPCKAYPGNPLNFKEGIDLVVFRENTEDLYAGVEFSPVPQELAETLESPRQTICSIRQALRRSIRGLLQDQYSCRFRTNRSGSIRFRSEVQAEESHSRPQSQRRPRDRWTLPRNCKEVAKQYPEIQMDDANIDAMTMWLLKNPFNYDVLVAPNLYGDIISDLCAQMVGGLGFGCSGNIGTETCGVRTNARLGSQVRRPRQGESHRDHPCRKDDA